jgi:hypothetical protein
VKSKKTRWDKFCLQKKQGVALLANTKEIKGVHQIVTLVKNHCESTLPVIVRFTYDSDTCDDGLEMQVETPFNRMGTGVRMKVGELRKHRYLFYYLRDRVIRLLFQLCSYNRGVCFLYGTQAYRPEEEVSTVKERGY